MVVTWWIVAFFAQCKTIVPASPTHPLPGIFIPTGINIKQNEKRLQSYNQHELLELPSLMSS